VYLLVRITILCSHGSCFCKWRVAVSWARSAWTSVCCLAGRARLVFVLEKGEGTSDLVGWRTGLGVGILEQYLCVCLTFILPQYQVNSSLVRPAFFKLRSR